MTHTQHFTASFLRPIFITLLFLFFKGNAYSQPPEFKWGVKAGSVYSKIDGIDATIISENYFSNLRKSTTPKAWFTAGGFVNYRFSSNVGFESGLYYTMEGSDFHFSNDEKQFYYKMSFDYQYINFPFLMNFYPFGGKEDAAFERFSIDLGVTTGLNVSPERILYKSWGSGKLPEFGEDLEQQQQLRNVLKGRTNFGLTGGLSFRFRDLYDTYGSRFSLHASATYGISDVIETLSNSYNFIDNRNQNLYFQFMLGFAFDKFTPNKYTH